MAESFQRVPWRSLKPTISGPKPTEKVSTRTPHQRATRKWPSSWKKHDNAQSEQKRDDPAGPSGAPEPKITENVHFGPVPTRSAELRQDQPCPRPTARMTLRLFRARGHGPTILPYGQRRGPRRYLGVPRWHFAARPPPSVASTSSAMPPNPIRPAIKAATAISLAALRIGRSSPAGFERPAAERQRRETVRVRRLEGQRADLGKIELGAQGRRSGSAKPGNGRSECACRASRAARSPSRRGIRPCRG